MSEIKLPDFSDIIQGIMPKGPKKPSKHGKNSDLTVNVTMMGGRRCGKTSVLAAMEECFQRTIYKDTDITCYSEDETTLQVLQKKKAELDAYFVDRKGRSFQPDDTPTHEVAEYSFCIGLRGAGRRKEDGRIHLVFHDYPGEWLENHQDDLNEILEKSDIILIAIDTPYMLEEKGKFNKLRNNCDGIRNAIMRSGFLESDELRMILFVPLKCEKYHMEKGGRHGMNMHDVVKGVQGAYAPLVDYINRSPNCFSAITPVYTLGDAYFSDFERDENQEFVLLQGAPQKANYMFTDEAGNSPRPLYCDQPLFYILACVLAMAKRTKEKGGPLSKVRNLFQEAVLHWPSAQEYIAQYDKLAEKIKETRTGADGYEIVNNCSWMKDI